MAKSKGFIPIISSPCFELWFFNHFSYSTRDFSSKELIRELRKKDKIPNYRKNKNVYEKIKKYENIAIKNSKSQKEYHLSLGKNIESFGCNPLTNVDEIFKIISQKEE